VPVLQLGRPVHGQGRPNNPREVVPVFASLPRARAGSDVERCMLRMCACRRSGVWPV